MEGKEFRHKIMIVGDSQTGKSSFVKRLVHNLFSPNYTSTIGVDFALKTQKVGNDIFSLELWDVDGQERFGNMTRVYYKGASGAFVIVDARREATLAGAKKWKDDLDAKINWENMYGQGISPVILLINKTDLVSEQGAEDFYEKFCQDNGFQGWLPISVKNNIGVDLACNAMIEICKNAKPRGENDVKLNIPNFKGASVSIPHFTISDSTVNQPSSTPSKPSAADEEKMCQSVIDKFLADTFSTVKSNNLSDSEKIDVLQMVLFTIYFENNACNLRETAAKSDKFMKIIKDVHDFLTDDINSDETITLLTHYVLDYGLKQLSNGK